MKAVDYLEKQAPNHTGPANPDQCGYPDEKEEDFEQQQLRIENEHRNLL